jgi:hypothetical protein
MFGFEHLSMECDANTSQDMLKSCLNGLQLASKKQSYTQ